MNRLIFTRRRFRRVVLSFPLRVVMALAFFVLSAVCLVGCPNQDAEAEQATAQSVTDLGHEARKQLSNAEIEALTSKVRMSFPLQPMHQLQADAAVRKANQ